MQSYVQRYMQNYEEKVSTYINEQTRLCQNKTENIKPATQVRNAQPLKEQITELMHTLPRQLLNRPWSMSDLVLRLNGKYRDKPHAKQVGEALRALGWKRVRYWCIGYDGARLWLPPECKK